MTDLAAIMLAFIGFDCFVALGFVRYRHRNGAYNTRLLLMDVLLAVAAFEIVADRMQHLGPEGSGWQVTWSAISAVCQGALVGGGIALVLSYQRGR